MLRELKFVMGAVAKKDFIAAMTHFTIENGHVRAFNGVLALSSPIALNINCHPKAQPLVAAIARCDDVVNLTLLSSGKLKVSSGDFSVNVECSDDGAVPFLPEGQSIDIDGEKLLACFKALNKFIGNDASRPWTNGVLIRGGSAFATNNVMLIQYWLGVTIPHDINIPECAVAEILRVNEAPVRCQLTENSITFHFSDGRWIRSQLYPADWPDVEKIINVPGNCVDIPNELYNGLELLKSFCGKDNYIYLREGRICTHLEQETGAEFAIDGLPSDGCYRYEMLVRLKGVAKLADFSRYPSPCPFQGDMLRGVFIGVRV